MTTISSMSRRILLIVLIAAVIIGSARFAQVLLESSATRDCLYKNERANACGVELLERMDDLSRDAVGARKAMITFSGSAIAGAPEGQRAKLSQALGTVYPVIDDQNAACFFNSIYDITAKLETNRMAMAVGLEYLEFVGTVSDLENPLNVILAQFDPTEDTYVRLLEVGVSASAASDIEIWAYTHTNGCL